MGVSPFRMLMARLHRHRWEPAKVNRWHWCFERKCSKGVQYLLRQSRLLLKHKARKGLRRVRSVRVIEWVERLRLAQARRIT